MPKSLPIPDAQTGLLALNALLGARNPLAALEVFHQELGDVFRINLPGFKPVVLVGPEAARFVLVQARGELRWRNEDDPVTDLLRHGLLVEDGQEHDTLRRIMSPPLHKKMLTDYVIEIWELAARVTEMWRQDSVVDMLVEMRKVALLVLNQTLFRVDVYPQLQPLWEPILRSIHYISPGIWMLWQGAPRFGYQRAIRKVDNYLYAIILERRNQMGNQDGYQGHQDILSLLIAAGMNDGDIRDQLLTMLIAGHDTVTALMTWALYLLGSHPSAMEHAGEEVSRLDATSPPAIEQIEACSYLSWVVREALRLYPPIHLGSRLSARDLEFNGYRIPAGERVIYSIYLTQRHPEYWEQPHNFIPERFAQGKKEAPYSWLAFGGGPRNCIGAAFGRLEAIAVLAYVLRHFEMELIQKRVTTHMGATLEPRPGVMIRVRQR